MVQQMIQTIKKEAVDVYGVRMTIGMTYGSG
jgi:hypothetical protein